MLELKILDCLAASRSTQMSNIVRSYIESKDFLGLMSLSVDVKNYSDTTVDDFYHDYVLASFLKKSVSLDVVGDEERHNDAYLAFFEQENRNRTNAASFSRFSLQQKRLIEVGKEFGRILGALTPDVMESIEESCAHGPGSALFYSTTGKRPSGKFTPQALRVTSQLLPFAETLMGPRWFDETIGDLNPYEYLLLNNDKYTTSHRKGFVRDFSTFSTVPKTALKDRPIAVEPLLNLYLQKGIGAYIKKRLKKFGINLQKGQSFNKELVMNAWALELATIDLSAASDSICLKILADVAQVTENGRRWFALLNLARTSHCYIEKYDGSDGQLVELEKFSSMGNGFTFELESLLFFCLVRVTVPRKKYGYCGVYGDDIIVPHEHAYDLIQLLGIYGFQVNRDKTFVTGPFYESCGTDVYKNINCRPIFADKGEDGTSAVSREVKLANAIRLYSLRINGGLLCSKRYLKAYSLCLKLAKLPNDYPRVPPEMEAQGLIVPLSDALKRKEIYPLTKSGLEGYSVPTRYFKSISGISRKNSFLLHALISIGRTEFASLGSEPILRGGGVIKTTRSIVPYWNDTIAWDNILP